MTTLEIVGDSGSPWVTPQYPLKGVPKYPPAHATIFSLAQYCLRRRRARGTTTYDTMMLKQWLWSRVS